MVPDESSEPSAAPQSFGRQRWGDDAYKTFEDWHKKMRDVGTRTNLALDATDVLILLWLGEHADREPEDLPYHEWPSQGGLIGKSDGSFNQSTLSNRLAKLIRLGLIEERPAELPVNVYRLTDQGRDALDAIFAT